MSDEEFTEFCKLESECGMLKNTDYTIIICAPEGGRTIALASSGI